MSTFYENLFAAKKKLGKISKDSQNPFFNSKYFDINKLLEEVEPVLFEHGLFILQPLGDGNVTTRITDDEGMFIESSMPLPNLTNPQQMGSAVTYYRRYTLQSLLALQAEDDDGNHAAKPEKPELTPEQLSATLKSNKVDQVKAVYDKFKLSKDEKELILKHLAELAAK